MQLVIEATGQVRCIYGEAIDLNALGQASITRASYVEPQADCRWLVDLTPVRGPQLGPFARRSDALAAEVVWLLLYWLHSDHR